MRGEQFPQAIAGYSSIGNDIVSITSLRLAAEDDTRVNEVPKAAIRADLLRGQAPLTVFFDGRDSFDSDGFIQSYRWGLENGDLGRDETLEYEFIKPGVYAITLTVTDNEGAQNSAQISIEVTDPGNDTPDSDLHPEEEELLLLINAIRQDNGLSPLNYVKELGIAARRHSDDMAQNNFMSHTGSDGSSPWDRLADAGYQYYTAGENVAAGYSSPNSVATGWMNSSGHRANILNPNFCEIGAGYAYGANSSYGHYWTLDVGCSK
ncbi:MAG: hypothetical protein GY801_14700 [bacterium]|nr:hypothetical protein [bacterium]